MTRMENLEALLSSSNDNDNLIIELDNFIAELCSYGDDMSKLTEAQKMFYLNQNLEREINNGGFNQYFYNSSGNFAHQTIKTLQAIGANITADILQEAIDQFPDKIVPQDQDKRQDVLETIEEIAEPVWEELDQKFLEYPDNLYDLNLEFIKTNKNEF